MMSLALFDDVVGRIGVDVFADFLQHFDGGA